jgi:sugar-specific transcriptional regulator TrmB
MIEKDFQTLGFNQSEVKMFLAAAEIGKAPASLIAKRAGVRRPTGYAALENLVQKGIVSIEQESGVRLYIANSPDALKRLILEENDQLEKHAKSRLEAAEQLAESLRPIFKSTNYSIPKLQFFDGKANVESMLYEYCFQWSESIENYDRIWWGYQDVHFVQSYRKWLDYYWPKMHPDERIKLLTFKDPTEIKLKGKIPRREIRFAPAKAKFSSTIWVLGDFVVTIMTRQTPHYAFQLRDSVFAANQRQIFQMLWTKEK